MPDFAEERSGIPLGGEAAHAPANAGMPEVASPLFTVRVLNRSRLDDATRMLDGIGGLGWSVIGFVLGAVFWHFIGFWGFVADVVLAGGPDEPMAVVSPVPRAAAGEARAAVTEAAPAAVRSSATCTLLVLDRRLGRTVARPCTGVFPKLPADSFQGREDRVAVAEQGRP
jgi:hypothetical protein